MHKKVLIATTNKAKIQRITTLTAELPVDWLSFADLAYPIPEPEETGKDGAENALIKASYYFEKLQDKFPVITQDDTLFIDGLPSHLIPGKDIKKPVIDLFGKFSDANAYTYYTNLISRYTNSSLPIEFRCGNAYADGKHLETSRSVLRGRILSTLSKKRTPGYFLAAMVQLQVNGVWKYYSELTEDELMEQDHDIKRSISYLLHTYLFI